MNPQGQLMEVDYDSSDKITTAPIKTDNSPHPPAQSKPPVKTNSDWHLLYLQIFVRIIKHAGYNQLATG